MPMVIGAISASVMASLLIYLHLHRQLLQDLNSGSDCELVLTYPSPCGLPVPKATIKLGNTGEYVLIFPGTVLGESADHTVK